MALSTLRDIDIKFKQIVEGYIGIQEKQTADKLMIPDAIKYLCLEYYLLQEYFDSFPVSQTILKVIDEKYKMQGKIIYGNVRTININDESIAKYIWKFKILSFPSQSDGHLMYVGLRAEMPLNSRFASRAQEYRHTIMSDLVKGYTYNGKSSRKLNVMPEIYDEITMILDVENVKLGFAVNSA